MEPVNEQHAQQLTKLVQRLFAHNNENSAGSMMGQFLGLLITAHANGGQTQTPAMPTERDYRREAEDIFHEFVATLTATGLELVQNRGRAETLNLMKQQSRSEDGAIGANGTVIKSDKLELGLVDGECLIKFLRSMSPKFADRPEVKSALNFVASSLDEELVYRYCCMCTDQPISGWEQFIKDLELVVSEFNRLDLNTAATTISAHLEHTWQGDLREFLLAEQAGLLGGRGFGPRDWQRDSTSENFQERWDKVIDAAELIASNPKASDLLKGVLRFLNESADFAETDIKLILSTPEGKTPYWANYGPSKLEILEQVKLRLDLLGSIYS